MVTLIDKTNPNKGLIINRRLLHQALVDEFNKYLKDRKDPTSLNILGENLREKNVIAKWLTYAIRTDSTLV